MACKYLVSPVRLNACARTTKSRCLFGSHKYFMFPTVACEWMSINGPKARGAGTPVKGSRFQSLTTASSTLVIAKIDCLPLITLSAAKIYDLGTAIRQVCSHCVVAQTSGVFGLFAVNSPSCHALAVNNPAVRAPTSREDMPFSRLTYQRNDRISLYFGGAPTY